MSGIIMSERNRKEKGGDGHKANWPGGGRKGRERQQQHKPPRKNQGKKGNCGSLIWGSRDSPPAGSTGKKKEDFL